MALSSADLLLICVVILWGTVFTFGKIALTEFDPTTFAALRTIIIAATFLILISLKEKNALHLRKKDILPFIVLGLLGHFLNRFCFSYGLNFTTASNASLIMTTTPIHAALFATLLRIERVTIKSKLGIIIAFFGVIFVIKGDLLHLGFGKTTLLGDFFILGASLSWALYSVYVKRLLEDHSILKITVWSAQFGAAFMVPFIFRAFVQGVLIHHSLKSWLCLLYVSLLGNALAQLFWVTGISRIGSTKTTTYQALVPLVAILFAAVVLEERLLGIQFVGGVLILGGVYLTRVG